MNASAEAAAWIGAITGSLALLWDIIKWGQTGPRIRVSVAPNMAAYGAAEMLLGNLTEFAAWTDAISAATEWKKKACSNTKGEFNDQVQKLRQSQAK